jgi:regulator of protease activity HflC (stomatin/prohibitin superfamily)
MGFLDDESKLSSLKREMPKVPKAKVLFWVGVVALVLILYLFSKQIVTYVESGTYQVKQSWINGKVSAMMVPGWYVKLGDIYIWPIAETFYFTKGQDSKFDVTGDHSVVVQFNEGSECNVSGTCRVTLPRNSQDAVDLIVKHGYRSWDDLKYKLVQPQVRLALILSANQMNARESYSEKRADFITMTADQLLNGLYAYDEVEKEVEDPVTGKKVFRTVKVIRKDQNGVPIRRGNPFRTVGVTVDNFEVRAWHYSPKVIEQIGKQQQAYMDIQTAIANAQKAEQDRITAEAEGKAKVAKARYEQETVKAQEVVKAQKDKEVAELGALRDKQVAETAAKRDLEVAIMNAKAAEQRKLAAILEAEGISKSTKMKMEADNYRAMEIQAAIDIQKSWADAYAKKPVPLIFSGKAGEAAGSDPSGQNVSSVQHMVDLMLLNALQSNQNLLQTRQPMRPVPGGSTSTPAPPAAPAPTPTPARQQR